MARLMRSSSAWWAYSLWARRMPSGRVFADEVSPRVRRSNGTPCSFVTAAVVGVLTTEGYKHCYHGLDCQDGHIPALVSMVFPWTSIYC